MAYLLVLLYYLGELGVVGIGWRVNALIICTKHQTIRFCFYFLVGLGFELRVWGLQNRCSIT
jgi:hypothetical protein